MVTRLNKGGLACGTHSGTRGVAKTGPNSVQKTETQSSTSAYIARTARWVLSIIICWDCGSALVLQSHHNATVLMDNNAPEVKAARVDPVATDPFRRKRKMRDGVTRRHLVVPRAAPPARRTRRTPPPLPCATTSSVPPFDRPLAVRHVLKMRERHLNHGWPLDKPGSRNGFLRRLQQKAKSNQRAAVGTSWWLRKGRGGGAHATPLVKRPSHVHISFCPVGGVFGLFSCFHEFLQISSSNSECFEFFPVEQTDRGLNPNEHGDARFSRFGVTTDTSVN